MEKRFTHKVRVITNVRVLTLYDIGNRGNATLTHLFERRNLETSQ